MNDSPVDDSYRLACVVSIFKQLYSDRKGEMICGIFCEADGLKYYWSFLKTYSKLLIYLVDLLLVRIIMFDVHLIIMIFLLNFAFK